MLISSNFKIKNFMVFLVFISIAFASLRSASSFWAKTMFSIAVLAGVLGTIGVFVCRSERRNRWVGFSLAFWFYFIFTFFPYTNSDFKSMLISSYILDIIFERLHNIPVPPEREAVALIHVYGIHESFDILSPDSMLLRQGASTYVNFHRIGHALFSIIIALLCSRFAIWVSGALKDHRDP
jgi:hypothetical protein